jgi:hypothetical protein
MVLGGSLKRREHISARLADMMSQLYSASTVLKYYVDQKQPASDVDYVCWSLQQCLAQMHIACEELFYNFPHPWIGTYLNWIIFPFGKVYRFPKDSLQHAIVSTMLCTSSLRDRLTQYCYVGKNKNDLSYRLDTALAHIPIMEPIYKKLQHAMKERAIPHWYDFKARVEAAEEAQMITTEEAQMLIEFEKLRGEIIKVDEFSFDLHTVMA